jgi:hypothetical protein
MNDHPTSEEKVVAVGGFFNGLLDYPFWRIRILTQRREEELEF